MSRSGGNHQQIDGTDFGAGMAVARKDNLSVEDIRKAMDWRDRFGGAWLAAARVVGCSEHALRLACDPAYRPVHAPARPVLAPRATTGSAPAARPASNSSGSGGTTRTDAGRIYLDSARGQVLAVLGRHGELSSSRVAFLADIPRENAREALNHLKGLGLVQALANGSGIAVYALTTAGEARVDGILAGEGAA